MVPIAQLSRLKTYEHEPWSWRLELYEYWIRVEYSVCRDETPRTMIVNFCFDSPPCLSLVAWTISISQMHLTSRSVWRHPSTFFCKFPWLMAARFSGAGSLAPCTSQGERLLPCSVPHVFSPARPAAPPAISCLDLDLDVYRFHRCHLSL